MSSSVSLQAGLEAVKQERYLDAIEILEAFCQDSEPGDREYIRARMHLIETYQKSGQAEHAIGLCDQLLTCSNAQVQIWAQQMIRKLCKDGYLPIRNTAIQENRTAVYLETSQEWSETNQFASADQL